MTVLVAGSVAAGSWDSFFSGMLTALAALTGLLFVAISNNLTRILDLENLVSRAAQALCTLVILLIVCGLALLPQRTETTGVEVTVLGGAALALQIPRHVIDFHRDDDTAWRHQRGLSRLISTLPTGILLVIGGVSLLGGAGVGRFWLAFAMLVGIIGVSYSAWVLLVEILRAPGARSGSDDEP